MKKRCKFVYFLNASGSIYCPNDIVVIFWSMLFRCTYYCWINEE